MNIVYFDNIKLQNIDILTINFKPKDSYTFDFFIEKLRKKLLLELVDKIKNNNPIIIYSLCKTTSASILYVYELNKIIDNKITLVLFSPMLSLDNKNFLDRSQFEPSHSIYNVFKNFTPLNI